jgi:hypothetical protein
MANLQIQFKSGGNDQLRQVIIGTATTEFLSNEGAILDQQQTDTVDRLSVSSVNRYAQGDTIAGYVRNLNSSDTLASGNTNDRSFMEIAFLGGL